jgi:uncharacterized membrane protein YfhO
MLPNTITIKENLPTSHFMVAHHHRGCELQLFWAGFSFPFGFLEKYKCHRHFSFPFILLQCEYLLSSLSHVEVAIGRVRLDSGSDRAGRISLIF